MKITTPQGILEGDNIEAILKEHGYDCLRGACLCDASLSHIDLRSADLRGANLRSADLRSADLSYADLSGANLNRADLNGADLRGVNLSGADLSQANLSGANHVKLSIAKTSILPDEGDIIGWKKAYVDDTMPPRPVIVKLLIPADAQRSNATGRKCRASTARVLDLQDKQGNSLPSDTTAYSVIRRRLHLQKRRNHSRRRLRHQPVERMRSRHPLLHHPHRSSRILGDSK